MWLISCQDVVRWPSVSSDFKKLRRQLQRKCHIKFELCVKLSVLRLFHEVHFRLLGTNGFQVKAENDLLLRARVVVRTSI